MDKQKGKPQENGRFLSSLIAHSLYLWFGLALPCIFIACHANESVSPALPQLMWRGQAMVLRDTLADPDGHPIFRFTSTQNMPQIECRMTQMGTPWEAERVWQEIPGERKSHPRLVIEGGQCVFTVKRNLAHCRSDGKALLADQDWQDGLQGVGVDLKREPEFANLFLQQNRVEWSGFAAPRDYLGVRWQSPVYGMLYQWLQDTVAVILAGPQDSLFFPNNALKLGLNLVKGEKAPSSLLTGLQSYLDPEGRRHWWKWGQAGWVGIEGCSAAPPCSVWAEKQYEALKLFERDGFFSLKNAFAN